MITDRFKSSKEIWKLSYEEVIKVMQEELENAMSEYGRFNDLLEESELYDESGVVEEFLADIEEYIEVLEDAIDVYERQKEVMERLSGSWSRLQRMTL